MTGFCSRSVGPLLLLSLMAMSCGSSRQLQTVTLQPAVATAQNGQMQFTATGTFSKPPSPVTLTSKDVSWCVGQSTSAANPTAGVCVGNIIAFATVDQNGLATCNATMHGTGFILAGTSMPMMSMNPDGGGQLKVFGSATLTCP